MSVMVSGDRGGRPQGSELRTAGSDLLDGATLPKAVCGNPQRQGELGNHGVRRAGGAALELSDRGSGHGGLGGERRTLQPPETPGQGQAPPVEIHDGSAGSPSTARRTGSDSGVPAGCK